MSLPTRPTPFPRRQGFTLIELLVVIAISMHNASVAAGGSVDDWNLRLHKGGLIEGFMDGHVEFMKESKLLPIVRATNTRLTASFFDPTYRD